MMKLLKALSVSLLMFALWLGLAMVSAQASKMWNTHSYQAGDTIDGRFRVAVMPYGSVSFDEAKTVPHLWNRQPERVCSSENCLIQAADGSLIYHDEGALWYTESRYRIDGNRLEPLSFVLFTFGDVFLGMMASLVVMGLGKYGFARWRYRRSPEQAAEYHRALWRRMKRVLLWLGLFVLVCLGMGVVRVA